ncbi:MAG: DinB family protein [Longimicrobiales bacterium]
MDRTTAADIRAVLDGQLRTAWKLLDLHWSGLTDEECLWRPATRGLHVFEAAGIWRAEWPDTEAYSAGPPSIAWLTWHIGFWWSMLLDHSFGDRTLHREAVTWPGTADRTRAWLTALHDNWVTAVLALPDEELYSTERTRWPFTDRPFFQLAAWLNLELMKNAAEIGYCRFLFAVR